MSRTIKKIKFLDERKYVLLPRRRTNTNIISKIEKEDFISNDYHLVEFEFHWVEKDAIFNSEDIGSCKRARERKEHRGVRNEGVEHNIFIALGRRNSIHKIYLCLKVIQNLF